MGRVLGLLLLCGLLAVQAPAQAQGRIYNQAELDAMLAPVALYPDVLLSQILEATTYPEDVHTAAAWSRANPQLRGDDALQAVEPMPWHPSVKALVAFPELLARMDESPRWVAELGEAFLYQEPHVLDTVQQLRRRAQASGALQSNEHQQVVVDGGAVVVHPVQPHVVYVPYYNPYVVYGGWWWPAYRPVFWRPWPAHTTVIVTHSFVSKPVHRQRPRVVHRPPPPHFHNHVHRAQSARPIVESATQARPFFDGSPRTETRREHRREPRSEERRFHYREPRSEERRFHHREPRGEVRPGVRPEVHRGARVEPRLGARAEPRQHRRAQ